MPRPLLATVVLILSACGGGAVQAPSGSPAASAAATLAATSAPSPVPSPVDLAAAKAEGTLSWYTSTPQNQAQKIADMFTAKTGIKVQLFRSGGEAVMTRFLTEQDAGKTAADVVTTSDPAAFNGLARDGKLLAFTPAGAELVPASAKGPNALWISQRLNLIVPAYRTDKVTSPPASWKDLADPRFKGQLVMADPAFTSFAYLVVHSLSRDSNLGWDYFKKLAANGTMIVQGHAQLATALISGERTVAIESDAGQLFTDIQKGAPIKILSPTEGVFLINSPMAIPVKAPHPNAARAFVEFNLTPDVQQLFATEGTYSVRTDVAPPKTYPELKALKIIAVDYDAAEKENKQAKDMFAEIFK
jgi:iron(III) transport system substrate-binding protein